MRCLRMSQPGSGPPDMPRDPEMSAWTPKQDEPEPKWGWPAAFWFAATLVFLTWLGIWRVVSWLLA